MKFSQAERTELEVTPSAAHLHRLVMAFASERLSGHPQEKLPSLIAKKLGFAPAERQQPYQDTERRPSDTTAAVAVRANAYT